MPKDVIDNLREMVKAVESESEMRDMTDRQLAALLEASRAHVEIMSEADMLVGVLAARLRRSGLGKLPTDGILPSSKH